MNVSQAAVDRVMNTYGMLVNLSSAEEKQTRERVVAFLATTKSDDETQLAVEGLRFLRAGRSAKRRRLK